MPAGRLAGYFLLDSCMGDGTMVTAEYMRDKLREWHPTWNIDKFLDNEIAAIYQKERAKTVEMIIESYQ